jgi:hypothetical protein
MLLRGNLWRGTAARRLRRLIGTFKLLARKLVFHKLFTPYTTSLILMRHWRQLGLCDCDLPLVRTMLIWKDSDLAAVEMEIDLTSVVGHLFHHNPTYPDLDIARRITEDYNLEHLMLAARFVKRIRLEQGWLRRHNDPAAAEMQEASTIGAIEQLLAEGCIRLWKLTYGVLC